MKSESEKGNWKIKSATVDENQTGKGENEKWKWIERSNPSTIVEENEGWPYIKLGRIQSPVAEIYCPPLSQNSF